MTMTHFLPSLSFVESTDQDTVTIHSNQVTIENEILSVHNYHLQRSNPESNFSLLTGICNSDNSCSVEVKMNENVYLSYPSIPESITQTVFSVRSDTDGRWKGTLNFTGDTCALITKPLTNPSVLIAESIRKIGGYTTKNPPKSVGVEAHEWVGKTKITVNKIPFMTPITVDFTSKSTLKTDSSSYPIDKISVSGTVSQGETQKYEQSKTSTNTWLADLQYKKDDGGYFGGHWVAIGHHVFEKGSEKGSADSQVEIDVVP
ncbi:MAG: hypothetical protein METHP_00919 [Methanoregula sp. SKADARSKE-2]|nr:MAG: hypothetical protein METHP_00919 [Methanoregula sp. SKADARSKE-2]